ncbi:MAG: hypothetical protein RLZZ338_3966 [Cyanobacteriota bacterium]
MLIRTIAVSYSRRFNLENYNSVELSTSMWARISDYEDEDMCCQILQDKCRESVRAEYIKVKNGSAPVEIFSVNTKTPTESEEEDNFEDYLLPPTVHRRIEGED